MFRLALLAFALALSATACGVARVYPYAPGTGGTGGRSDCPEQMLGFAEVANSDVDGGSGPTTGGNSNPQPQVPVNNIPDLVAALQSSEARVIILNGMLTATETVKITVDKDVRGGNKTLIGMGENSGLTGAGLDLSYADNVIVRNLKISKVSVGEGDAITILNSRHIWIDHCDLSSDRADTISGYDGLVDITHGSAFVTVSWTLFHDHKDTSLVGHTADPTAMAEDSALRVTYHHNMFLRVNSGPRVRWGIAHVANNLFQDVTSFGVVSESAAVVWVARNMFDDDVTLPIATTYQDPTSGTMVQTGDQFPRGFTVDIMRPTIAPAPLPYSYEPDRVDSVSLLVSMCAGTGKLGY